MLAWNLKMLWRCITGEHRHYNMVIQLSFCPMYDPDKCSIHCKYPFLSHIKAAV